ncbi:DUF362 domain-containing protein [Bacilliculturomica massiliensis]|uniref:DUF362 domain-containing protein n=1 Tax=Bacilliculturomica massiliensis TaxID=1917867 RepID=UPI00102F58D2|nr:DUF362 domain-containing protein [Bacilliculturomica massiliensis]
MVKVAVARTGGHDYESIKAAVDRVISLIGGIEDIIRPGYKVVIKPNLVATPTDRLSGGVTRWEVCMAIYEAVQALGAYPVIAESSAAGADTESVIAKCGYQELRDRGIPVIDLKAKECVRCRLPVENGVIFQELDSWELVRDADAIITVPVMKTHDQTEITLGMKNCKGLITDQNKKAFHAQGLIEGVCDLIQTVKPVLEIVDGTFGQQGLGPIFGETKEMNLIVGSRDLVACETVTGLIMGYEPEEVMLTGAASRRGLGEMDMTRIEVVGEKIEDVKSRFKRSSEIEIEGLPSSFRLIFDEQACTGCRNTVISSLMDMKAQELFEYLENMNVIVGPVKYEDLPKDADPENTVLIGKCTNHLKEYGFRSVKGCPPGNADTVQGILGGRLEYGVRYS